MEAVRDLKAPIFDDPKISLSVAVSSVIRKRSKKQAILGFTLMLISGVLYAGLATLVKWGFTLGYSAAEMLTYRASVQMVVASALYIIKYKRGTQATQTNLKDLERNSILATVARGIMGAGSTFTYFQATTMVAIGDVVTLKGLAAVFTSIAGII